MDDQDKKLWEKHSSCSYLIIHLNRDSLSSRAEAEEHASRLSGAYLENAEIFCEFYDPWNNDRNVICDRGRS